MNIAINRQSICMADDIDDHTTTYTIHTTTKFSDIFQDLIRQNYFPHITGNDVIWTLLCGEDDLITWKTKEDRIYHRFIFEEPLILNVKRWANTPINFKYYPSPIARAQHIFTMFNGSKFHIWHEGFMSEYETYHIPQTTEDHWRQTLTQK